GYLIARKLCSNCRRRNAGGRIMTKFEAKVIQDIPANRLIALGGVNSEGDMEEGWETVYLKLSERGWIPDLVSTSDLEKDSFVNVTIKNNPVWKVESSEDLPAGTLVQCDDDGRVKHYRPEDGNHFGFTTHSVKAGEVVKIVRKYGSMPQNQEETMAFTPLNTNDLTVSELKQQLDEKGVEYKANATKKELIELLEGA